MIRNWPVRNPTVWWILHMEYLNCKEKPYSDVRMGAIASQINGLSVVYSTVCSGGDQRKHQSSASLAFVRGIHRWPVNSLHKKPLTRKMIPFDDVIMWNLNFLPYKKIKILYLLHGRRYGNPLIFWGRDKIIIVYFLVQTLLCFDLNFTGCCSRIESVKTTSI